MRYNEQQPQRQVSSERREWQTNTSQTQSAMNTAMVRLWTWMAGRFHPQWTNHNGDIGGAMFQAWTAELGRLGPDAVERGIRSIDLAGSSYAPNLNKFVSACRVSDGGAEGAGESYSEQLHGGRIKPTPDGLPLCYLADGDFSVAALRDTEHYEDAEVAHKMESSGWTYQEYRQNKCAELGLEYATA